MIMQRMLTVKDLGVCYDSQFSFREQINNITSKAGKMLGFIIRNCKEFSNISILKTYAEHFQALLFGSYSKETMPTNNTPI